MTFRSCPSYAQIRVSRELAQSVRCPRCRAAPEVPCRGRRGPRKQCHARRHSAYLAGARGDGRGYYLVRDGRKTCCANPECGRILQAEYVFRFEPMEALCLSCAEDRGIDPLPSARWGRDEPE
jgi:hypothetical protein